MEVHEVPSDEVRIVPESPTTTKVLFPNPTALSSFEDLEFLVVQEAPSEDVNMAPALPYAIKVLFTNPTPLKVLEVPEFTSVQDVALLVDLKIFPPAPAATNVLFPKVTPSN